MKRIIQISLPVDVNVLKVALQWQCCVVLLIFWKLCILLFYSILSQKTGRSYICVLGVSTLPLSTILIFDFGIVRTV